MGNGTSSLDVDPQNYCIYYGKSIVQDDFNFCPYCGSKLINQRHQEIDFRDLKCSFSAKDLLGSGTYAKVYRGKTRGVDVAIKVPNLDKILPHRETDNESTSSPTGWSVGEHGDGESFEVLPPDPAPLTVLTSTGSASSSSSSSTAAVPQKERSRFSFWQRFGLDREINTDDGDAAKPEGGSSGAKKEEPSKSRKASRKKSKPLERLAGGTLDEESSSESVGREAALVEEEGEEGEDSFYNSESQSNLYQERFQNFLGEVRMLRELNHPNICLLMGTCFVVQGDKKKLLLIYELMDEDLNSYINYTRERSEVPSLFARLRIASQVASGLSWVSSKGIIHGDLKPTNILRKGDIYKVTDFGLATFEYRDDFEGGAPIWSAPEILERRGTVSRAVDVFSFGYLLWHMLLWKNEDELYPNIQTTQQLINIVCEQHATPDLGDLPQSLRALVKGCLAYDPADRPDYDEIIRIMNDAMLDVCVPEDDPLSKYFWKHWFSAKSGTLKESVPTTQFLEKYARFLGLSSRDVVKVETLKEYFDPYGRGSVSLEFYGRLVALFGPVGEYFTLEETDESSIFALLERRSKSPTVGRPNSPTKKKKKGRVKPGPFVDMMIQLRKEPWFCGPISTEKVEETLKQEKPGAFLVRYSNNPKAYSFFCLSRVTKGNHIRHHYIQQRKVNGFKQFSLRVSKVDAVSKPTISELLRTTQIVSVFYLLHPINKISSFSQPHLVGPDVHGYLSNWEIPTTDDEADESKGSELETGAPDYATSPPSIDVEWERTLSGTRDSIDA